MLRKYKLGYDKFRIYELYGVILCTGLFTSIEGKGNEVQNEDSMSLIAEFVQNFMKPYIEAHSGKVEPLYQKENFQAGSSYQKEASQEFRQSASEKDFAHPNSMFSSSIKSAIKETVNDLQPFLQDDEYEYDKYFENDETTIIEILPKYEQKGELFTSKSNVPNIYHYEKMKSDIKQALEKENVSHKTRRMVTKTLDELIAQVLSNKCNWRSVNVSSVLRSGKPTITSQEWDDLKTQYLEFLDKKQANWSRALHVFNVFHDFFSKVINETQSMSGRTRFKCQVIDEDRTVVQRTLAACADFKVCSTELKDFLQHTYDLFNGTVVSVFTNYAAMYVRDVLGGEHGKTVPVPNVIQGAAKIVEQRVAKVYIQELPTFKLDKHRTQEVNIRILRNHVKSTVRHVLKHIKKHIFTDLAPVPKKLLEIIQKDIDINLNVELGNQETELKQRICTFFMTCNGKVSGNRRSFSGSNGVRQINPRSIFVELQINVDEKPINDVSQTRGTESKTKNYNKQNFRVTRTTVNVYSSNMFINLVK